MEHAANLTGLTFVVMTALIFGMIMAHFRQPAIVGYLIAGVVLGPTGLGIVESRGLVSVLAELGVLLLLFVVGMELSVRTLKYTWRIAVPAVAMQILGGVALMALVAWALDLPPATAILLGFVIALSSTAVAVKLLEEIGALRARVGRVTVAVLIAQDLAFLPMLLIVNTTGAEGFTFAAAMRIAVSVLLLVGLVWLLMLNQRQHLPFYRIITGHVDLGPLAGLFYCFGASAVIGLLGLSPAYGAFLAGLTIGNSAEREPMLEVVRPIQSVMLMVFFLSIGLLIDLNFIWQNLGTLLVLFLIVTLLKSAMNIGILHLLNESWPRAFLGGVVISQIGEFSFLLAASGLSVAAISPEESKLVVSVTVFSLALSPFWLITARRLQHIAARRLPTWRQVFNLTFAGERFVLRRGRSRTERVLQSAAERFGRRKSAGDGVAEAVPTPAAAAQQEATEVAKSGTKPAEEAAAAATAAGGGPPGVPGDTAKPGA